MGFFDSIMGRSKPVKPNLDSLFAVPSAAITMQAALGYEPTGDGSVCFRAAGGAAFATLQADIVELLKADSEAPEVRVITDEYGFTWIEVDRPPGSDINGLCTGLHSVNTSLEAAGFGPSLLCTVITFTGPNDAHAGLVYLYKQGTFYPFCPQGDPQQQRRDNLTEINLRDTLSADLPMERDTSRWLALWGAPGL